MDQYSFDSPDETTRTSASIFWRKTKNIFGYCATPVDKSYLCVNQISTILKKIIFERKDSEIQIF